MSKRHIYNDYTNIQSCLWNSVRIINNHNRNGAKMYGLTGISVGVSSFLGPILTKIFVNEDKDYRTIYFIGAGFVVIDIIALITFKEEPYNYFGKLKEKVENNNEHSLISPTSSAILDGQPKLTPKYSELIINHNTNSTN